MNFGDKDILQDLLTTEKQALGAYGTGITESSCQNLRNTLLGNFRGAQEVEYKVFDCMKQKGWYKTKDANSQEVQELKTESSQMMNEMMQ
ncbi:coat F domain-containing protein [Alkalibaculum bacchi]|uniref:Coat F domain-containing protein n=1 Tax=Alkalibaculum bacchi TaxID=645887 RepID=A0A366I5W9_9FIRM|nr:spore coat protein [Alkalibaculum bacchi]RBP63881.1 coat F domain-containing protein [Alkalibaculum bacchi]